MLDIHTNINLQYQSRFYKNGTDTANLYWYECQANGTFDVGGGGTTLIDLDKDDYIDIRVYHNVGGAVALNTSEEENYISVERIGF